MSFLLITVSLVSNVLSQTIIHEEGSCQISEFDLFPSFWWNWKYETQCLDFCLADLVECCLLPINKMSAINSSSLQISWVAFHFHTHFVCLCACVLVCVCLTFLDKSPPGIPPFPFILATATDFCGWDSSALCLVLSSLFLPAFPPCD